MDVTRAITSHIGSASFAFLTSSDIRALSVKRIVNPVLLDNTNLPTAGGLYDAALGPMKKDAICSTCAQNHFQCPGHFGHIELPQPVFHPLFMTHMFNLLRGCCVYCHHFKLPELQRILYVARLRLLEYGLVSESDDLASETLLRQTNFAAAPSDDRRSRATSGEAELQAEDGDGQLVLESEKGQPPETPDEFRRRIEGVVGVAIHKALREGRKRGEKLDGATYAARKRLVGEFMKLIILRRQCAACQAFNPTLRKDGFIKIVERDLTERERALHEVRSIRRPDAVSLAAKYARGEVDDTSRIRSTREGVEEDNTVPMDEDDDGEEEFRRPVDKSELREARKKSKVASQDSRVMPPVECRANLQLLFAKEGTLCSLIFGRHGPFESGAAPGTVAKSKVVEHGNGASADVFFMDVVAVAPTRFRPASVMGDTTFENPQNELLTKIIQTTFAVYERNAALAALSKQGVDAVRLELGRGDDQAGIVAAQKEWGARLTAANDALMGSMIQLQVDVNSFIDSSKNPTPMSQGRTPPPGVKQALEKKEGLFRKHMMGKRVNFAARSVISPDVNIETNEIGVPPVFAKKLTFPEPVTVHNVALMRELVINGPDTYPGAVAVRGEDGYETLLGKLTVEQRTALASQLLTPQEHTSRSAKGTFGGLGTSARTPPANKQVLRHLRDGDILLLNRQPTLHKPSIMAHRARVLMGEKTIRMHYANCNSYNADFDGDEMNMHFPQSQAARAECYNIANTDNQYLVPTSGKPLRGLIQDHVVAGVWMTCKNTLYTREEYQQLLYGALRPEDDYSGGGRVITVPPAIVRPEPRWTGKQVISTIMLNIKPAHAEGLNMTSRAKVAGRYWGKDHAGEEHVIFHDGDLLSGVLDKSQFGATAYGLVHAVYEIYGADTAGKLLSILSRLFTKYLQHNAFTCRMDDLMLSERGDDKRRTLLQEGSDEGRKAALRSVGLEAAAKGRDSRDADLDFNMRVRLEEVLRDDAKLAALDAEMMSASNVLTSAVIDACIPHGLAKVFPHNNMQMMTVSGAKGSPVNVSQISCLLGPQALEGRRVPVMVSGKTLPSFKPFDTSARAGGFVGGRFLTGIRPQEYYFHCMAGREGLIDTAVKTSRSGYLQRCLIKHLEGVYVHYDHTVRNSDGSVLQFHYGEDSLDVTKSKYLEQFDFTAQNFESFKRRYNPTQLQGVLEEQLANKHMEKALKKPHKYGPAMNEFPPAKHIGSMSEKFARKVEEYIERNPRGLLGEAKRKKSRKSNKGGDDEAAVAQTAEPRMRSVKEKLNVTGFRVMNQILYHRGLVEPGEAVGLLAAQGVGEPSTQMTLNTFHFAGHGAANVTLGIPRLREIVMTASQSIKTPIMRLPVLEGISDEAQRTWCKDASRLLMSQVVDQASVSEKISPKTQQSGFQRRKTYTIRLDFFPPKECKEEYNTSTSSILHGLETTFVPNLERGIITELKRLRRDRVRQSEAIGQGERFNENGAGGGDDEEEAPAATSGKKGKAPAQPAGRPAAADADDSDEEAGSEDGGDGDADDAKRKQRSGAHASYEDASSDEEEENKGDTEESLEAAFREASPGVASDAGSNTDSVMGKDLDGKVLEVGERLQESSRYITNFEFDSKGGKWAEMSLQLPSSAEKLLLINVVERACRISVVHEVPNITRLLIPPKQPGEKPGLTAEGINFRGMWDMGFGVIDMDQIYTNDIGALLHTYGVEAARAAIVNEMAGIFQTYGIDVSMRHLYLIADYQTASGGFRPFSRGGIADSSSPLLKASFEMTMAFLGTAALHGESDPLEGPSANIVVGRPVLSGTGAPMIHQALPVVSA